MTKVNNWIRKFLTSPKTRAVALMLLVGGTAAFAQTTAGDYTAGTNALTTVAEEIALRLGADIEEIVAVDPYAEDFSATIERCNRERSEGILPEIAPVKADLSQYDVIFLGFPVWYGICARPVLTLLEGVDLAGKKVVPFCTFGSGGLQSSTRLIAEKQPGAEILPGYGVRAARIQAAPAEIDTFLKAGGFLEGEYEKLEDFPESHPVSEAESALFDAAVDGYPMIHAKAVSAASRTIPGGTEYLFTAVDEPRDDAPVADPGEMQVYVTALEGEAPVFTQVVR